MKQISRAQGGDSYNRESRVNSVFFSSEGETREKYSSHIGKRV